MEDFATKVTNALAARSKELGRKLKYPTEWHEIINAVHAEDLKTRIKDRKKAQADERADNIFNLYPRREGGLAARISITRAIEKFGYEHVLERTAEYAKAVAGWPRLYRYAQGEGRDGKDLCPMATTWFNQERFQDDPRNWHRTGGRPAPEKPPEDSWPEPRGWRLEFPNYDGVTSSWANIEPAAKRYITETMNRLKKQINEHLAPIE